MTTEQSGAASQSLQTLPYRCETGQATTVPKTVGLLSMHPQSRWELVTSETLSLWQSLASRPAYALYFICLSTHTEFVWVIEATDEYLEWFAVQPAAVKELLLAKVYLLREFGPKLGRPQTR